MFAKKIIPILLLSFILSNCASVRVMTHYDKAVDFTKYKTYRFVNPKNQQKGLPQNPFFSKEIMSEIRPVLEAKGYTEATSIEEADMLIHFYSFINNETRFIPPTYHVGRWGRTWVAGPGHAVHVKEGTLAIDIVDREEREVIWQGVGKDVLDRRDPSRNLVEAVSEILKEFPPEPEE